MDKSLWGHKDKHWRGKMPCIFPQRLKVINWGLPAVGWLIGNGPTPRPILLRTYPHC